MLAHEHQLRSPRTGSGDLDRAATPRILSGSGSRDLCNHARVRPLDSDHGQDDDTDLWGPRSARVIPPGVPVDKAVSVTTCLLRFEFNPALTASFFTILATSMPARPLVWIFPCRLIERNNGPDEMAADSIHVCTERTGQVSGLEPYGIPTFRPSPA